MKNNANKYGAINAKVSAMRGKMLRDKDYDALLSKGTVPEIAEYLFTTESILLRRSQSICCKAAIASAVRYCRIFSLPATMMRRLRLSSRRDMGAISAERPF